MRVSNGPIVVVKKEIQPLTLSFEDMREQEGIYKMAQPKGHTSFRFIVIGQSPSSKERVVLLASQDYVQIADLSWNDSTYKFARTDEQLEMKIK